jgi:hypothetical protein
MRDFISIGPSPVNEECVQTNTIDYDVRARAECRRFIELIRNKLGPEPPLTRLGIETFTHNLRTYMEVVCYYNANNDVSIEYAYRCEAESPESWE